MCGKEEWSGGALAWRDENKKISYSEGQERKKR